MIVDENISIGDDLWVVVDHQRTFFTMKVKLVAIKEYYFTYYACGESKMYFEYPDHNNPAKNYSSMAFSNEKDALSKVIELSKQDIARATAKIKEYEGYLSQSEVTNEAD